MKAKEFAAAYGVDQRMFEAWLPRSGFDWKPTILGSVEVLEENHDEVLDRFRYDHSPEKAEADAQLHRDLATILITSGFSFDGYTITKYSGYISGDDVIEIDRGTVTGWGGRGATSPGSALTKALVILRRNSLMELKHAAHALGCNAVIGVDFDYLTLEPETANSEGGTTYLPYVFAVTANGNAVTIEKNR